MKKKMLKDEEDANIWKKERIIGQTARIRNQTERT